MEKEVEEIPELRFSEFTGNWSLKTIKEISTIKHGFAFKGEYFSNKGKYIILTPGNFNPEGGFRYQGEKEKFYTNSDFSTEYILEKGDLLTVMTEQASGLIGSMIVVPESDKFLHNQRLGLFQLKPDTLNGYLFHYMKTEGLHSKMSKAASGMKVRHTSPKLIGNISLYIPTLPEQQKIATFLSAVDKKIEHLTRKKELLEHYKKGVMQKIFLQEIRFKGDNGQDYPDWEEKRLGEIACKINNKNRDSDITFVLTNSATKGIISQQDYFDKDIANQNNLEGYYKVEPDDFVYNPRISTFAPVGPIKRNHLTIGVMSPLYTVFRFVEATYDLDFFECYFETTHWHKYMHSIANFGARHDRMNITNTDFLKMPLPIPCKREMEKICGFLSVITRKIKESNLQLTQTQNFKKGLLQKMFV